MRKSSYEIQADEFLKKTKTTMTVVYSGHGKYFPDDKEERDIYTITLSRPNRKPYTFTFGQSLINSRPGAHEKISYADRQKRRPKKPSAYDVLACLEKYELDTHEDFCADFGYDTASRKGLELYLRVQKEQKAIYQLFSDVMDELREIQ